MINHTSEHFLLLKELRRIVDFPNKDFLLKYLARLSNSSENKFTAVLDYPYAASVSYSRFKKLGSSKLNEEN